MVGVVKPLGGESRRTSPSAKVIEHQRATSCGVFLGWLYFGPGITNLEKFVGESMIYLLTARLLTLQQVLKTLVQSSSRFPSACLHWMVISNDVSYSPFEIATSTVMGDHTNCSISSFFLETPRERLHGHGLPSRSKTNVVPRNQGCV